MLVLLLLTQWHGPFRFLYWYPVASDHALHCFLALGLICIHFAASKPRLSTLGLGVVVLVGVMFREVVLLLAVALLFADNPIRFKGLWNNLTRFQWREIIKMPRPFEPISSIVLMRTRQRSMRAARSRARSINKARRRWECMWRPPVA